MGWVVKEWSSDGLERLLNDRALATLRSTRQAAERDARRARRAADRAAAEAEAHLDALEALGRELQMTVRTRRAALRAGVGGDAPLSVVRVPRAGRDPGAPVAPTAPDEPDAPAAPSRGGGRRGGRASLRASPLTELFRPTEPRRPAS